MTVAGDTIEIQYNHPSLGTGTFLPKAGETFNIDLGGLRSADDTAMITGSGDVIDQMSRKRWSIDGPIANDMNTRQDAEKLNALASSPVPATWTITFVNGATYSAVGKPVGDLAGDSFAGTLALKVSGGNKMKKIAG